MTPVRSSFQNKVDLFTAFASLQAVLIGSLALAGWVFHKPVLASLNPQWQTMKVNTALSILCCGSALYFSRPGSLKPRWASLLSVPPVLLGLATLLEVSSHWDLGLDDLFFKDPMAQIHPGRMSPVTAILFVLLGAALLTGIARAKRSLVLAQAFFVLVILASTFYLLGYLFHLPELELSTTFTHVALPTAFSFFFLGLAGFALRPQEGLTGIMTSELIGGRAARLIFPIGVLIPIPIVALRIYVYHAGWFSSEFLSVFIAVIWILLFGSAVLMQAFLLNRGYKDLLEKDQLLNLISGNMTEGIVVADKVGRLFYFNPEAEKMLGRKVVSGDPSTWAKRYGFFQADRLTECEKQDLPLTQALQGAETKEVIFYLENKARPDGLFVAASGRPLKNEKGEVNGALMVLRDITEEMKVREGQRLLNYILEQTPDAILATDLGGEIIEWNKGAERLFGYTRQEALGKLGFLVEPETKSGEGGDHRSTLRLGGEIKQFESMRKHKDGRMVQVSVSATPIKDPMGKLIGYSAIYRDITEQKRALETQRRLSTILEQTPDAVLVGDLQGNILEWNQGAERLFGYHRQEVLGQPAILLEPDSKPGEIERLKKAIRETKGPLNYETVRKRKDGTLVHVEVSGSVFKDPSGTIIGFSAIYRDITEKLKAQENQRRLVYILEQTSDAVLIADLNGDIVEWNKGAETLFGYTTKEALGQPGSLLDPESQPGAVAQKRELLREGGEVQSYEAIRRSKNGRLIPVEVTAGPLKDPSGKILGYSAIYRDISEKMRAQGHQRLLAAILEQTPDAVVSADMDEIIIQWNEGAERMFGYPSGEALGKPLSFLVPDHLAAEAAQGRKMLKMGGKTQAYRTTRKRKNGSLVQVDISAAPIHDPSGKAIGFSATYRDITEQLKAQETQRLLANILEQTSDGVVIADLDNQIIQWNKGAERLFQYPPAEVLGKSVKILIPGDQWTSFDQRSKTIGENLEFETFETTRIRKDGKEFAVSVSVGPIRDPAGKAIGFSATYRDIQEQRKAQETQRLLASILEQTPDGVILSDMDGIIRQWNKGAEAIYGYPAEEIIGKPGSVLEPPGHEGEVEKTRQQLLDGQDSVRYETVRKRKDGRLVDISATRFSLVDHQGRTIGFAGIIRDITETKKGQEIRTRLATILQQTPDAVVTADLEGRISSWNRGAEEIFGHGPDEALGKPLSILIPPEKAQELAAIRETAMKGGEIKDLETVRLRKDGTSIDVSLTVSEVRDTTGNIIGSSAIIRDISERKKAEESLRQQEERMRQLDKMNAIGRLAGGVAHDFNNLLSVIGGNAEFLLGNLEKADPNREEVEEIQKAIHRGADLTKQMLVFSKKQVTRPQPLDLNQSISEIHRMLKRTLDAGVELSIQQDKAIKPIHADPGQIHQAVMNLALNARDAMPNGGSLIIETKAVPARDLAKEGRPELPTGKDYVRLRVTDTGTGMPPEVQKHIFEPFFTTKAEKGTGLGLANVFGIVNQWGGSIYLESAPGKGTTFTLYFPADRAGEVPVEKGERSLVDTQGNETILVAEDEEAFRKLLRRTLEKQGYRVLEASNGTEGVLTAMKHSGPIHLLLTDTIMPKMNGKELADELAKTHPEVKVLFMSGYTQEVLSQEGVLDPKIDLIQKPFEFSELTQKVRQILDEKQS